MKVFVVFVTENNKSPIINRIFLTEVSVNLYIMSLHEKFNAYVELCELKKIPKEYNEIYF